jgi:hypothetical protein
MTSVCDICETKLSHFKNLSAHQKSEKCQNIKILIEKKISKLSEEYKLLQKEKYEHEITIRTLQSEIKTLEKKSEEYRKIVEKAATKSTKTINRNNYNNYLNYISSEPLKLNDIPKQLTNIVNCNSLMYDDYDFHEHIVDNILKDEDKKDKILCTDINRKNFSYKDEVSGELISDPELEKLRDKLKKGADMKEINMVKKELLNNLIKRYEDTGTDPYKKFFDIIKKLEFGNSFVDHVAKKTYIKAKSSTDSSDETINEVSEEFD